MGRIEYEYPLFKVYYSNNSNNSNIRGNPAGGLALRPHPGGQHRARAHLEAAVLEVTRTRSPSTRWSSSSPAPHHQQGEATLPLPGDRHLLGLAHAGHHQRLVRLPVHGEAAAIRTWVQTCLTIYHKS